MEDDDTDDLAALLEKELNELSDDEDAEFNIESNILSNIEVAEEDIHIEDELTLLMASANELAGFRNYSQELSPVVLTEETALSDPNIIDNDEEEHTFNHDTTLHDYKLTELTPEEKEIIVELLQLMVESVERCAPIFHESKILVPEEEESHLLKTVAELTMMTEDKETELENLMKPSEDIAPLTDTVGLLDDRITTEAKQRKDANILSTQQNDQFIWDESNKFKQEMEKERARLEERRRKREQARLYAIQEKSMIKIQKIIRGMVTRRYTTDLLRTHREKLANEAIERNLQKQREEEEKLKEELRLQRVQEAVETQRMGVLESESRQCWKEMAKHLERLRQQEIRQFTAEDSLATAIRDVVLQARCRIEAYASLVAQEDVEYDIPGYGSDSDSEEADEEAEKSTAVCANIQNSTNLSAAATIPAQSRDVSNRVEMDEGTGLSLQLHRTTAAPPARKPIHPPPHTPAPRSAKAVMTVDPTQGKKWGGSISTSAWNSPAVPAVTVNQAPVAHPQVKSGREAEGMGEPTPILSQEEDVKVQRPLPYSMCELAALETERQQTHLKLPFSAEGVDFARSCMNELFTPSENSHDEEGVCHHIEKRSGELVPAVVSALRCWRDWWVSRSASYSYSHLSMKPATRRPHSASEQKRSTSSSSGGKSRESVVSAKAERENEEALNNSMVDLETDPLLAKELDFCVEGLCSSTFLDKFKNLTKLALNVNKLTELHGVAGLLNLVSISAKDNKIASLSPLRGLQQLKYLHLDSNRIADLSPLSGLTQLTVLCVNSNHISDLPQLHCPSMQRLELSRNKLSSVAADCLSGLPVLNHLNLSSNQISTVCGETLSACGMLQTLLLSENRLEVVPHPLRLPMLKNLRLNLNRLTSLGQWEHNPDVSMPWPMCTPSLQKLVLSDNQIATLPGKIFQTLPLLQELDLSFNALTERDCLLGLASCRLLTALHIQDNIFTTTPVNTPAAGTSRTALAAPQLQQLCQWILSVCPALETVSGNRLDMSLYQEKMESLRSSQILDHYIRTSLWPDQQHCTAGTDVYGHELPLVQELISSLQTHHVCQNMLTVRERAIKKDELAANKYASNSKRININPAETGVNGVKSTLRDWDLELMELLKSQLEQLVSLASPPTLRPNAPTTVFLSFAKEHHIKCSTTASSVALLDAPPARAPDGTLLMAHKLSAQSVATPQLMPDSCVVALQQHFRGRRVRKRVSSALESIRYQDTELDDLFGEDFSLDQDFLDMSFLEEDAPVAMVYGDHIRRRSRPNSSVPMLPTGAEATAGVSYPLPTAATAASSLPGKQHTSQADSATHWVLPADDANSPPKSLSGTTAHTLAPPLDRPLTGMSSVSTLSAQSDAPDNAARSYSNNNSSTPSPAGSRSNLLSARSDGQNSEVISMMTSARRSQRANQAAMAQDWGITDPRVLAQMMKRTQRIQGFVEQKEKKERDKDPQYRLEQFQKSAQRMGGQATFGNTKTSGSFGGAPRTTRAAAGGGGKRKQMAVPAWMLGGEGEAKDSNGDS